MLLGPISLVPNLLRQESAARRETLHRAKIRRWIATGRKLVMAALAGQKWPSPAFSKTMIRSAIDALPVTVVVVSSPARAVGSFDFQQCIDYTKRVLEQRISCLANAVTHQFEKSAIHNFLGGKLGGLARSAISDHQACSIRILATVRISRVGGIDADEMSTNVRDEGSLRGNGPRVHVRFQKIRVLLNELGNPVVAPLSRIGGCTCERSNIGRQRRRRIAAGFLPALLLCDRAVAD